MTEPFKLKYQLIWLRLVPEQSRAGVNPYELCIWHIIRKIGNIMLTPEAVVRADTRAESV